MAELNSPLDLSAIHDLMDSGESDLLTDEERAMLPAAPKRATGFNANLADTLDEDTLRRISLDVMDGFDADETSRADWRAREKIGIRLLGISERADGKLAFTGASAAVHPGLVEAVIQFQARAIAELWPAGGPAKAITEGTASNPQREQQAGRVSSYLNWLYCDRMPGGYAHHDRMLFRLPMSGSVFKKVGYDALAGCLVSRFVPAEELVVPYGATDLDSCPRITHILRYTGHDLRRMMAAGAYRDLDLTHWTENDQPTPMQEELDAVTGTKPATHRTRSSERFVCLEQSIYLDVDGEPPNAPYLVTMEKSRNEVLAVYRDWREADEHHRRRPRFIHYYFLPGLDGFYGLGLLHVVGRLAESLSGNLRALLDAATLANLRGGFRSADVRLPQGNQKDGLKIVPGEWLPVEATADELQKLFVQIPYEEPSQTLFNLLHYLDELLRRVAGTTSELVGESSKNVPVGTTLARIEQGLKVQTAIQMRCHQAQAAELALMVQFIADTGPDPAYCRDVLGCLPEQFAADFDERVDVRPVSDPNAVTNTQRLIIAQALVEMAQQSGGLIDPREAYRRLLETMRVQDIDRLMPDPAQAAHLGPVEENMALTIHQPVRAYPDQDHTAHQIVHQQWLAGLAPDTQKALMPAAVAHIAEHLAWAYHFQMQQAMGMPLPAGPLGTPTPMDPQQENMMAMQAAQAVQLMARAQQPAPPPVDPVALQAAHQAELEQAKATAEIQRKDLLASASIKRDDAQTLAKMNRDLAEQEAALMAKYLSPAAKAALTTPPETAQAALAAPPENPPAPVPPPEATAVAPIPPPEAPATATEPMPPATEPMPMEPPP